MITYMVRMAMFDIRNCRASKNHVCTSDYSDGDDRAVLTCKSSGVHMDHLSDAVV